MWNGMSMDTFFCLPCYYFNWYFISLFEMKESKQAHIHVPHVPTLLENAAHNECQLMPDNIDGQSDRKSKSNITL